MGRCGIAWGPRGIVGVQLPEASENATRARILRRCRERCPDAHEATPPPAVQHAIDGIGALLHREAGDLLEADDLSIAGDLSAVQLDMDGVPPFHRRVYELARTIEPGETVSYGEIAAQLGAAGSARAVGQALANNPFAIVVPCHRVLGADGKIGGFSANGGTTTKRRLLSIERTRTGNAPTLFDSDDLNETTGDDI